MHPVVVNVFGWFNIHTYGLMIACGFLTGMHFAVLEARRVDTSKKGNFDQFVLDLTFWILIAAIIGSRIETNMTKAGTSRHSSSAPAAFSMRLRLRTRRSNTLVRSTSSSGLVKVPAAPSACQMRLRSSVMVGLRKFEMGGEFVPQPRKTGGDGSAGKPRHLRNLRTRMAF